jgi:hypothetical protein
LDSNDIHTRRTWNQELESGRLIQVFWPLPSLKSLDKVGLLFSNFNTGGG